MGNYSAEINPSSKRKIPLWLIFLISVISIAIIYFALVSEGSDGLPSKLPDGWKNINPPEDINSMLIQGDTLWAGGKNGVFAISINNAEILFELDNNGSLSYVKSLAIDSNSNLWIGHEKGLSRYDGKSVKTFTEKNVLHDNRILSVFVDSKNTVWAGGWGGVVYFKDNKWEKITKDDGLIDNVVNVIFEDSRNNMWFGTYSAPKGGVCGYNGTEWEYFSVKNKLPHNNVTCITEDKDSNIWVGCGLYKRGGAIILERISNKWTVNKTLYKADGLAGEKVRSLYKCDRNLMWIGSEYDGLAIYNKGKFKTLNTSDGLIHPEIKCIVQDKNKNFWIGTRAGISHIKYSATKIIINELII